MTKLKPVEHPTYYETVVSSPQWKQWVRRNEITPRWDVHESMECGWLSQGHFQAFLTQQRQDMMSELLEKFDYYGNDHETILVTDVVKIIKSLSNNDV